MPQLRNDKMRELSMLEYGIIRELSIEICIDIRISRILRFIDGNFSR